MGAGRCLYAHIVIHNIINDHTSDSQEWRFKIIQNVNESYTNINVIKYVCINNINMIVRSQERILRDHNGAVVCKVLCESVVIPVGRLQSCGPRRCNN